jgi:sn-glycerol 3-phosphate transport system substrate-binding protein
MKQNVTENSSGGAWHVTPPVAQALGMRTRRVSTLALLFGALALLAAACGGETTGNGDDGFDDDGDLAAQCPVDALEEWDAAADGTIEVVVWHSYIAETRQTLLDLADEYNASQDKVRVRVETQGQSYEELLRTFTRGIPARDLPAIAILEDTTTQFMADSGVVLPAQACFDASGVDTDDFTDFAVGFYSVDDVLLPASANLSTLMLYYNKEHFRQAGLDPEDPPSTLAELREVSEAIDAAGIVEEPIVLKLEPWFVEHMLTGTGEAMVDNENGRGGGVTEAGTLDSEAAVEALTWINDMVDDGLLRALPGTEGQVDHYFAVALQQVSMTFETSTAITTIDAFLEGTLDPGDVGLDLDALPAVDLDIGVAPYPALTENHTGQVGGGAWYLTNTNAPEVQAAAWDFARWINEPAQQVPWHTNGSYMPFHAATVDEPEIQELWTTTRRGEWLQTAYEASIRIDPDWPGPLIGPYDDFRSAVRSALDQMVLQGSSPEDALASANDAIDAALERYNDDF